MWKSGEWHPPHRVTVRMRGACTSKILSGAGAQWAAGAFSWTIGGLGSCPWSSRARHRPSPCLSHRVNRGHAAYSGRDAQLSGQHPAPSAQAGGRPAGPAHHDLAQLVVPGANVLHQHLEGCELELGGQRVELLLLHLLELHSVAELPHELDPEPGLGPEKARMTLGPALPPGPQAQVLGVPGQGSRLLPSPCAPGCQAPPGAPRPAARPPEASAASVIQERAQGSSGRGTCGPPPGAFPHHVGYPTSETRASALGLGKTSGETKPLAMDPHGMSGVSPPSLAASPGQGWGARARLPQGPSLTQSTGLCKAQDPPRMEPRSPASGKRFPSGVRSCPSPGTPSSAFHLGPTPTLSAHKPSCSSTLVCILNCCTIGSMRPEPHPLFLFFPHIGIPVSQHGVAHARS